MVWVATFILLTLGLAGGLYFYLESERDALRERLITGLEGEEASEPEDLTAGDYGLKGFDRFAYHVSLFLGTRRGEVVIALMGFTLGAGGAYLRGMKWDQYLAIGGGSAMLALLAVMMLLRSRRIERERKVKRELPTALELMAAVMEGGLGFEAALGHVLKEANPKHPLYFDWAVMTEAMQRGRRRSEALKLWQERCNILPVSDVASALIQADQTGASMGRVMHHHAQAMFRENEAEVERRAERLPVRLVFPMVFFILPATLITIGGPFAVRVAKLMEAVFGRITSMGGG